MPPMVEMVLMKGVSRWSPQRTTPIAINGRTQDRGSNIALDATQQQVEEIVLADETVEEVWLDGSPPKKIVYVRNRMINVVV